MVIEVAKALEGLERKYKIITPYAAQTSAIEDKMKVTEGLTWEDTCFNVDAFQGNSLHSESHA
jgi:superfamily I DNA and/or RNA helicase